MPVDLVHPYEKLTLVQVAWPLAVYLIGAHVFMLLKPEFCKGWLNKLPRHFPAGLVTMGIGLAWFWLLLAPSQLDIFPFLSGLSRNLAEFNAVKPALRLVVPLVFIGLALYAREFLFVRGLGVILLMAVGPLLQASIFSEQPFKFVVPLIAYAMLTKGLFFVGMPYLFRDLAKWATATNARWNALVLGGLGYGILVLLLLLFVWR